MPFDKNPNENTPIDLFYLYFVIFILGLYKYTSNLNILYINNNGLIVSIPNISKS